MTDNKSNKRLALWGLVEILISRNAQKILAIIFGGIFVWLGYRLFIMGVTGEFDFYGDLTGFKAKLASGSPGVFFALLGAITIICAVRQRKHVDKTKLDVTKDNKYLRNSTKGIGEGGSRLTGERVITEETSPPDDNF